MTKAIYTYYHLVSNYSLFGIIYRKFWKNLLNNREFQDQRFILMTCRQADVNKNNLNVQCRRFFNKEACINILYQATKYDFKAWCCISSNPVLGRQKQVNLLVHIQPGLHRELQANQSYIMRPCLLKSNKWD